MVDYHRMGNMEERLGIDATPTTYQQQVHWWKSPRWIVNRIEALAVVAIIFSFLLVAFGSCRRWSNSWIVQKGFLAAQVLSLSLGTYSIGLMQSSSAKSEMYPIWTVSLFTLFGCVDPITTFNGLDYMGPLSKVVYGICLNCGYVLLMSISTISNVVGNTAIITLSGITFVKSFHRSFALVQQNKMQDMLYTLNEYYGEKSIIRKQDLSLSDERYKMIVDPDNDVHQSDIEVSIRKNKDKRLQSFYDVCVALCLSQKLQRHFLGLDYRVPYPERLKDINYNLALNVIEIELAFVYDAFFTSNPFLHYYQAKTASLWALVSFVGICFVGVAAAIPGRMTSSTRPGASGGCTKVVDTTTADLAITFGILVSLALLQLTQLVLSWTSNWARAAIACAYARKDKKFSLERGNMKLSGWLRLKAFVATRINLFDKFLWQGKMSQRSFLPKPRLLIDGKIKGEQMSSSETEGEPKCKGCVDFVQMLGLHYIWLVIRELLSSFTNKRGGVKLDEDVKDSVIHFLDQIKSHRLDRNWLLSLPQDEQTRHFLPYFNDSQLLTETGGHCYRYTSCVLTWHIVTWYCELEEQKKQEEALRSKVEAPRGASYYLRKAAATISQLGYCFQRRRGGGTRNHRHVANTLSQYCAYLVKSAPELLPGPVAWTKRVYDCYADDAKKIEAYLRNTSDDRYKIYLTDWYKGNSHMDASNVDDPERDHRIPNALILAKLLVRHSASSDELWKTLELVWVQLLVYAAPYGNSEAHMRHLAQGGEFITHLWALLYHLDIRQWKVQRKTVNEISTMEEAERIRNYGRYGNGDDVVAYCETEAELDELSTASALEDGLEDKPWDRTTYYYTSDVRIAKHFGIETYRGSALVVNGSGYYYGEFRAIYIVRYVTQITFTLRR